MSSNRYYNLDDTRLQYWNPVCIDGKTICFCHLNAKKIVYERLETGDKYTFYVTYSHHVFSVKPSSLISYNEKHLFTTVKSDPRVFCSERYELSLMLPKIIEDLPNRICYHGGYARFCTCEFEDTNGNKKYYQIVFTATKSGSKLRLHIESAYPLNKWPGKIKKVNFWYIALNLLIGKNLPKPHDG